MLRTLVLLRYIICTCLLNLDPFYFTPFFTVLGTHTQRRGIKRKSKGLGIVKDGFLFFSFLGRLLFASIFILSAWQMFNEFGDDGGPAAKEWAPKLRFVKKFVDNRIGKSNLHVDGLGGLLFVLDSGFGAFLLIWCLVLTAPMLYDFYNYDFGEPEFIGLLHEFLQCVAFVGALLFFLGMKNSIPRQKKAPKPKTA